MALEVRRICELEGLSCFLMAGTFLGAIRHGGFIPWDDDMDMGMLREDYDKFIAACPKHLDSEKYCLQTIDNDEHYGLSFAKIRLKGTAFLEEMSYRISEHNEIFLDIFPYDNAPDSDFKRFFHSKIIFIKKHLIWSKVGYTPPVSSLKKIEYIVCDILSKPFSLEKLKRSYKKTLEKYNSTDTECVYINSSYKYKRVTFKRELMESLSEYTFEGERFSAPSDYEAYLKQLYGDYMKLPPEDQRDKHAVLKVDFGPYE